jgi:hypothetical protein
MAVKRVHVVDATTKATGRHHHLDDMRVEAGGLFVSLSAFVSTHGGKIGEGGLKETVTLQRARYALTLTLRR